MNGVPVAVAQRVHGGRVVRSFNRPSSVVYAEDNLNQNETLF